MILRTASGFASILFLTAACGSAAEQTTEEAQASAVTPPEKPSPICDAFAGICVDRDHVSAHGCGGGSYAVDAEGWCASASQVCCVIAAP
jgi:hypothetical protein